MALKYCHFTIIPSTHRSNIETVDDQWGILFYNDVIS